MALDSLHDRTATAEKLGYGRYMIYSNTAAVFYLGTSPSAMSQVILGADTRVFIDGPVYFEEVSGLTIQVFPDTVKYSEGSATGSANLPDGGGDSKRGIPST